VWRIGQPTIASGTAYIPFSSYAIPHEGRTANVYQIKLFGYPSWFTGYLFINSVDHSPCENAFKLLCGMVGK